MQVKLQQQLEMFAQQLELDESLTPVSCMLRMYNYVQ